MSSTEPNVDNGEWDIDDQRGVHETEEQWGLRREFLSSNKGQFSKYRLICLSQVFANMEFLGCKYPRETMELVAELSAGIAESYRENQETKLKRTFVNAQSAAENKSKRVKTN